MGATTIWITGYKNGGGTVSKSFSVTNSYQLKSYTDLTNLSSLVITGGTAYERMWMMDDFTYNLDPEIDVKGNGVSIADGDDSPTSADHTDFGEASVSGGAVVRTFTILNNGAGDLSLSGSPRVSVSPTNQNMKTIPFAYHLSTFQKYRASDNNNPLSAVKPTFEI